MEALFERKSVRAPAKINIRLKVIGKRADGYHELETIMAPVGLYDLLEVKATSSGIRIHCEGLPIHGLEKGGSEKGGLGKNLAARAAEEFFSAAGIGKGAEINLVKKIPVAAGLGGGSSDAASTLMVLNGMFGQPLLMEDLSSVALKLGADVPFFLKRGICLAGGIGEVLRPIPDWPDLWYVIVVPPLLVSTSWVYGELKSHEIQGPGGVGPGLMLTQKAYGHIISLLAEGPSDIAPFLENDLETVTVGHFPVIREIKNALLAEGAKGALMSGSGPSVFGIFSTEEDAIRGSKAPNLKDFGDVFVVKGI